MTGCTSRVGRGGVGCRESTAAAMTGCRGDSLHSNGACPRVPDNRAIPSLLFRASTAMAQYVFTMNRVGKIVPPKRQILKDVSLSFFPGAKIGVLGVNGSGKSTLLKIMAGLDKEIEGEAVPMPG